MCQWGICTRVTTIGIEFAGLVARSLPDSRTVNASCGESYFIAATGVEAAVVVGHDKCHRKRTRGRLRPKKIQVRGRAEAYCRSIYRRCYVIDVKRAI